MNKTVEKELAAQYAKIATNLNNNPSEEYLDKLLETFSQQLSSISEKKQDYTSQKQLLRRLTAVKDNSSEINLTEDQKITGSIEKLKVIYEDNTEITTEQMNRKIQGLQPYLEIIENIDLHDYTIEDEKFLKFLETLLLKKRKGKFRIKNIGKEVIQSQEVKERLNSYFSDKKKPIKKFSAIVERINEDSKDDWNINQNLLNTFWLALRNSHLDQSTLNRVKSLFNSGSTIKEAIRTVVTNQITRSKIKILVKQFQLQGQELQEARKRLY